MKVVVVGGGFGGLAAVKALADVDVEVTLIDRNNHHLFQPLLYQVATGALSPANIAAPLRGVLSNQGNVRVVLGEVTGFDLQAREVLFDGRREPHDVLVVAAGSTYNYFGRQDWEATAPSLKTLDDATEIRARLLNAFEEAELAAGTGDVGAWLTFVVIGGGPTGVELAGAIAELARHTLAGNFRNIRPEDARIVLVELEDRVLPPYPPGLSRHAEESLQRLGVEVRLESRVTAIDPDGVTMTTPQGEERIAARTVLWAAGVRGTALATALLEAAGLPAAPGNRVAVTPYLHVPGHPEVFVVGDLAYLEQDGQPLPAVAPVAMQQGAYAAKVIAARLSGAGPPYPFRYRDRGTMATIGRSAAVADFGLVKLHGFVGWLAWLLVHLVMLVRFENKVLVMIQWAWNYFTRGRSARLITKRGRAQRRSEAPTRGE